MRIGAKAICVAIRTVLGHERYKYRGESVMPLKYKTFTTSRRAGAEIINILISLFLLHSRCDKQVRTRCSQTHINFTLHMKATLLRIPERRTINFSFSKLRPSLLVVLLCSSRIYTYKWWCWWSPASPLSLAKFIFSFLTFFCLNSRLLLSLGGRIFLFRARFVFYSALILLIFHFKSLFFMCSGYKQVHAWRQDRTIHLSLIFLLSVVRTLSLKGYFIWAESGR